MGGFFMTNIPTKVQESGSLWIMKKVLNENRRYLSPDDIKNDKDYNELKKIFKGHLDKTGDVPETWIENYYKQQEAMLKKFSSSKFTEFKYSGTSGSFHDFIKDIYKQYKKGRYENWNPADIWIVSGNSNEIKSEIEQSVSGSIKTQNISRLNSILRKLFKEKKVIGISLKKISRDVAKFEEVNIDLKHFMELDKLDEKYSNVKKPKLDLTIDINNPSKYETQDLIISLDGPKKVKFQIKGNQTTKYSNLKYEAILSGSGGRSGKAEVDKVSKLIKFYTNKEFSNKYSDHPKTYKEFNTLSNIKKYLKLYNKIKNDVETNISGGDKEFLDSFTHGFKYDPIIANTKLLLMEFISIIIEIPKNKLDDFWVDMVWLSEKKGGGFGPHGKLY